MAVVLKCQFQRNAASGHPRLLERLEAARKTGRLLELSHGRLRNTVFPAEAALTADLTIGHIVGGTASLESALAGRRSVLLNPYGYDGANNPLYARADIVYGSMAEALEAVARHRVGDPGAARLGDWSDILPSLDPFRDSRAADRINTFVSRLARGEQDEHASPANPSYVVQS